MQSEGSAARYRGTAETRRKILAWREKDLSAGEIAQLLSEDGVDISVRMAERVLAKKGFPKLPRRTRLKIGLTVKEAEVPQKTTGIVIEQMEGRHFVGDPAGVFLFAPFLEKFQAPELIRSAGLPGTKVIPAVSYFLPFLALKLISTERYAPLGGHAFDPGLGLFAVLNVLPKCTAMSTYSYSLDEVHILELQQTFVKNAVRLGLSDGSVINLDFQLNSQGIRFITLRRRNLKLIGNLDELKPREKIHIPHDKRKYPDPYHQSLVALKNYEGQLRQIIIRGNGHEEPAFLITNDISAPVERIASDYAHRWRVENVISEAVKLFNLNALSSPILVKVHFDVLMTMIADTLYRLNLKFQ